MGMALYSRRDIANVLHAMAVASEPEAKRDPVAKEAIGRTLVAVGAAFGLEPVGPSASRRPGVSPAVAELLWAEVQNE